MRAASSSASSERNPSTSVGSYPRIFCEKRIFWISSGVMAILVPPYGPARRRQSSQSTSKKDSHLSMRPGKSFAYAGSAVRHGRSPRSEDRRAHPHVGGPLLDRHLEVVAHPHGEPAGGAGPFGPGGELVAQRAQAAEPGAGFLGGPARGRNGHQAHDPQVLVGRQGFDRLRESFGGKALLGLLGAQVHLQEAGDGDPLLLRLALDGLGDRKAVDRVDGAEEAQGGADLV